MTRRRDGSSLFGIPSLTPPCPLIIAYLASAPRGQPRVIASSCVVVILPAELAIHGAEQLPSLLQLAITLRHLVSAEADIVAFLDLH